MYSSNQDLFNELSFYTLAHPDTTYFIHQHAVDAYTAQQANEFTKPVAIYFALVGLYLYIEKGFSGKMVQLAHMRMAKNKKAWPVFKLPQHQGEITVSDVLAFGEGPERDRKIKQWCISVWESHHASHEIVARLVQCGATRSLAWRDGPRSTPTPVGRDRGLRHHGRRRAHDQRSEQPWRRPSFTADRGGGRTCSADPCH